MKLTKQGLQNKAEWEAKGYSLPQFDREKVEAKNKKEPFCGSFFIF